jgi:hypothetical protein
MNHEITIKDVTDLLNKYHERYELIKNDDWTKIIRLYDSKTSDNFVTLEITKDNNWQSIACAGKIIGGLSDLEKFLG